MVPTEQEKADILSPIREEIHWCLTVRSRRNLTWQYWVSHIMRVRLLMAFFEGTGRNGDVFANHFGFADRKLAISEDNRLRLNKDVAHLTYARLRHTNESQKWEIEEFLGPIRDASREFVKFILKHPPAMATCAEIADWRAMETMFYSIYLP